MKEKLLYCAWAVMYIICVGLGTAEERGPFFHVVLGMLALIFFMGMFIDWIGIVAIIVPIFLPILTSMGFENTLWICTCIAVIMQTCFMTPPFGFALFYVKALLPDGYSMMEVYKGVIPFIIAVLVVTVLVVLFPDLCMWLPNLSYGS